MRIHTYNYRIAGIAAAKTLLYVTAGKWPLEILEATITPDSTAAAQMLTAGIGRVATLGTPTATTIVPSRNDMGTPVPSTDDLVVKANVTANEPTYGAVAAGAQIVDWWGLSGFSTSVGWFYRPFLTLAARRGTIIIQPNETYGIKVLSAPSPAADLAVEFVVTELANTGA